MTCSAFRFILAGSDHVVRPELVRAVGVRVEPPDGLERGVLPGRGDGDSLRAALDAQSVERVVELLKAVPVSGPGNTGKVSQRRSQADC